MTALAHSPCGGACRLAALVQTASLAPVLLLVVPAGVLADVMDGAGCC